VKVENETWRGIIIHQHVDHANLTFSAWNEDFSALSEKSTARVNVHIRVGMTRVTSFNRNKIVHFHHAPPSTSKSKQNVKKFNQSRPFCTGVSLCCNTFIHLVVMYKVLYSFHQCVPLIFGKCLALPHKKVCVTSLQQFDPLMPPKYWGAWMHAALHSCCLELPQTRWE